MKQVYEVIIFVAHLHTKGNTNEFQIIFASARNFILSMIWSVNVDTTFDESHYFEKKISRNLNLPNHTDAE